MLPSCAQRLQACEAGALRILGFPAADPPVEQGRKEKKKYKQAPDTEEHGQFTEIVTSHWLVDSTQGISWPPLPEP